MTQDGVGVVKHLLHVHGAVGAPPHVVAWEEKSSRVCFGQRIRGGRVQALSPKPTWEKGVLYAEHGWPVSVVHFLHELLFGRVRTAIFDPNPSFHVVEMAAVQLEELNQQHAQILVGVSGIDARVKLQRERRNSNLPMNISADAGAAAPRRCLCCRRVQRTCRKLMTMRMRL